MRNSPSRRIGRTTTLAIAVFCVLLGGCSRGGTVYSRGFSQAKFARIRVGMSEADVTRITGEPLEKHRHEDFTYYVSGESGTVRPTDVAFDNGRVYDWDTRIAGAKGVRARMTRQEVEARLGTRSKCTEVNTTWDYSHFDYFEGEVRSLAFSTAGRVTRIDSYTSKD